MGCLHEGLEYVVRDPATRDYHNERNFERELANRTGRMKGIHPVLMTYLREQAHTNLVLILDSLAWNLEFEPVEIPLMDETGILPLYSQRLCRRHHSRFHRRIPLQRDSGQNLWPIRPANTNA